MAAGGVGLPAFYRDTTASIKAGQVAYNDVSRLAIRRSGGLPHLVPIARPSIAVINSANYNY